MSQTTDLHQEPAVVRAGTYGCRCRRRSEVSPCLDGPFRLTGWRYYGLDDVMYERRTLLFGGPVVMSIAALASGLGNRRRRRDAERLAAPQWRPLGPVFVEVWSDRLVVSRGDNSGTVWLASVIEVGANSTHDIVDLYFEADAPYRFEGADAPHLWSAIESLPPSQLSARPSRLG